MLVLTLSSYNDNDGSVDELQGVFPGMDAIVAYIKDQWGEPKKDNDYTKFMPASPNDEVDDKTGLRKTHESQGYIDNGYGGRYYAIWEPLK